MSDEIVALVRAYRAKDHDRFAATVRQVIAKRKSRNHDAAAGRIERAWGSTPLKRLTSPPKTEKGNPLVKVSYDLSSLPELVLNQELEDRFNRVVKEHEMKEVLSKEGLLPMSKLLFYGQPGCGKTLAASHLARRLNVPLVSVRFESLVSSYLGETAKNMRQVFDYASGQSCVLFVDEFDALGRQRGGGDDVGEARRIVNMLLQLMDEFEGTFVAATNYQGVLDFALYRRFDETMSFNYPESPNRIANLYLPDVDINGLFVDTSPHEIVEVCKRARKRALIDDVRLTREIVESCLQFRATQLARLI